MKPLTDADRIPGTDDLEERMNDKLHPVMRDVLNRYAEALLRVATPVDYRAEPAVVGDASPARPVSQKDEE